MPGQGRAGQGPCGLRHPFLPPRPSPFEHGVIGSPLSPTNQRFLTLGSPPAETLYDECELARRVIL